MSILGIPFEFILFGLLLFGIAIFHHHALLVANLGLLSVSIYKVLAHDFSFLHHVQEEAHILLNLFGLLLAFELLAQHFKDTRIPDRLPAILPDDWKGAYVLLCAVFVVSAVLDNIAAAMIGGTVAGVVFNRRVHIGYLAGIVAASNAGGAGSVIGDTTTTMMWIAGVSPFTVLKAEIASLGAFLFFGYFAAKQQDSYQRILKDPAVDAKIEWGHLAVVSGILAGTVLTNVLWDLPALGAWIAILIGAGFKRTQWHELLVASRGAFFLLSLVLCASMMPVEKLPVASWPSTLALGFLSSVFDNIPLTKLAISQGGYDWGMLAFAVGYGGSMTWFGSSAGVAISNLYPEARNVLAWIRGGWHVVVGYVVGFFLLLLALGWQAEVQSTRMPHAPAEVH
jgi:Na+/H+ antiporter NhaD/arsenite permease-like protein